MLCSSVLNLLAPLPMRLERLWLDFLVSAFPAMTVVPLFPANHLTSLWVSFHCGTNELKECLNNINWFLLCLWGLAEGLLIQAGITWVVLLQVTSPDGLGISLIGGSRQIHAYWLLLEGSAYTGLALLMMIEEAERETGESGTTPKTRLKSLYHILRDQDKSGSGRYKYRWRTQMV